MTTTRERRVVVSGYALRSPFADGVDDLIDGLRAGRHVVARPYFATDNEARMFRLPSNPGHAELLRASKRGRTLSVAYVQAELEKVIGGALRMAGLDDACLSGKDVRVYLPGHGARVDVADCIGYLDRNDEHDLLLFPKIRQLNAVNFAQDALAHGLARRYRLAWAPAPMYSASSSSTAALHLAHQSIRSGSVRLALVAGWMQYLMQDIVSLGGRGMLAGDANPPRPFSTGGGGILPVDSVAALLLQREEDVAGGAAAPYVVMNSSASCQSSGSAGGNPFAADFRSVALTMEAAVERAGLSKDDIACVFPHGNGVHMNDKAEAMAIRRIWGERGVPVVTYKAQTGYASVCTGMVDVMIAAEALKRKALIPFAADYALDESLQLDFHANRDASPLDGGAILKTSLGLEGSIFALTLSRCEAAVQSAVH